MSNPYQQRFESPFQLYYVTKNDLPTYLDNFAKKKLHTKFNRGISQTQYDDLYYYMEQVLLTHLDPKDQYYTDYQRDIRVYMDQLYASFRNLYEGNRSVYDNTLKLYSEQIMQHVEKCIQTINSKGLDFFNQISHPNDRPDKVSSNLKQCIRQSYNVDDCDIDYGAISNQQFNEYCIQINHIKFISLYEGMKGNKKKNDEYEDYGELTQQDYDEINRMVEASKKQYKQKETAFLEEQDVEQEGDLDAELRLLNSTKPQQTSRRPPASEEDKMEDPNDQNDEDYNRGNPYQTKGEHQADDEGDDPADDEEQQYYCLYINPFNISTSLFEPVCGWKLDIDLQGNDITTPKMNFKLSDYIQSIMFRQQLKFQKNENNSNVNWDYYSGLNHILYVSQNKQKLLNGIQDRSEPEFQRLIDLLDPSSVSPDMLNVIIFMAFSQGLLIDLFTPTNNKAYKEITPIDEEEYLLNPDAYGISHKLHITNHQINFALQSTIVDNGDLTYNYITKQTKLTYFQNVLNEYNFASLLQSQIHLTPKESKSDLQPAIIKSKYQERELITIIDPMSPNWQIKEAVQLVSGLIRQCGKNVIRQKNKLNDIIKSLKSCAQARPGADPVDKQILDIAIALKGCNQALHSIWLYCFEQSCWYLYYHRIHNEDNDYYDRVANLLIDDLEDSQMRLLRVLQSMQYIISNSFASQDINHQLKFWPAVDRYFESALPHLNKQSIQNDGPDHILTKELINDNQHNIFHSNDVFFPKDIASNQWIIHQQEQTLSNVTYRQHRYFQLFLYFFLGPYSHFYNITQNCKGLEIWMEPLSQEFDSEQQQTDQIKLLEKQSGLKYSIIPNVLGRTPLYKNYGHIRSPYILK